MLLGLNPDEVRLADHSPGWKTEFQKVRKDLLENTKIPGSHIEHIGSTAITGIPAKPIIDIMAAIEDLAALDPSLIAGLKAAGFLQLKVKRPGEVVFARFGDHDYKIKTHFLHLVEYEGELWNNLLFFRDYLNENEDARKEYVQLKLDYIKKTSTGIKEYTDYKESFVKRIAALRETEGK
ncbi:GrpB family protein [Bacillus infantis]|uniref:GrpB family protein n=1 Tax=Bacillus infantis TaxID=324767 RepID=UPI001CD25268|nr:GrpB family protein [Bacillus infantis]MCA1042451.1 GrpB family protein [Bacillus infantis]